MTTPSRALPRAGLLAVAVLTMAAAVCLYLPSVPGALASDDWPLLEAVASPIEPGTWLDPRANAWFRPLSLLYARVTWLAFGTDAPAHRLLGLALFGLTGLGVGGLASAISGEPRAGALATLAFGLGATHAETLLWVAAHNEILAGGLCLVAVAGYVRYLRQGRRRWLALALTAGALALTAKETVYGLPLAFLGLELALPGPRHQPDPRAGVPRLADPAGRLLARPSVALALAVTALVASRAGAASPYDVSLAPLQLARNTLYSLGMLLAAVPADFASLQAPGRTWALLSALAATTALAGLLGLALALRPWRGCSVCPRAWVVAGSLLLAGLLPVAPIVTERTTYWPSMAVAIALGMLVDRLWRAAAGRARLEAVVGLLFAVHLGASAAAAGGRAADWHAAATTVGAVMTALADIAATTPPHTPLVLLGLPDRVGCAYAFRNALPSAATLWPIDHPVLVPPDTASRTQGPATDPAAGQAWPGAVVLRYVEQPTPGIVEVGRARR